MDEIIGRVTGEDLLAWREVCIEHNALEMHPGVFSKEETLDIVRRYMVMVPELIGLHAEDFDRETETRFVEIHPDTGLMVARDRS